ncbi:germinal-center associated nuclear protein-like isoform X2 [Acropora palmata]|uniref:germinal-center associated nuclear protein-like isoform X2 n=1 Tax=Acropora palmata TaxID=6131 RepID=UPI003DA0FC0E
MHLSQLRQKKKKEAVRRLSQGAGANLSPLQGPGQWPQRRKFADHRKVQRQLSHEANQRPAKRTHISPLHQDAVGGSNITQPKPIKPVSAGGFSFGNASLGVNSETTQVLQNTSGLTSFQSSDGFGSVFSSTSASSGNATKSGSLLREALIAPLAFSGLENAGEMSSKRGFGDSTINNKSPLLFGMAASQLDEKPKDPSSASQPLFPVTPFSATETSKPQAVRDGACGRAFDVTAQGQEGSRAMDIKGKAVEKKAKSSPTADLTTLVIREIPEMFNKNTWVKRFYSRFGEVTKVTCNAARKSATVTFKTHEAAETAKKRGKILRPGTPPVEIFWKQQGRRKSGSSDNDQQKSLDASRPASKSPIKSAKTSNQGVLTAQENIPEFKGSGSRRDIQDFLQTLQPSKTVSEKLHVVEGIDKKLRQVFKRTSDINSAKAITGTCKDMCPEKERYTREYQRRLSVFEVIPGTGGIDENPQVDHARAIKEYDRSAADKEEPLPHELRPVPVLKMTMDYLATNIMDLSEGREGEWFDFVWNRTRGIRKDITQQHLCDPDCVDLVEKTARFHIVCAHMLCEADINSFDAKINTENLTKCLQTLKQFYGDLLKDKGIACPHEAEFRAYDILLNLNEGDILREVMTFRAEVQKSTEVGFAMDVFYALNSNNFVRFFRLLRNSAYLSACLLHRYFPQIRSRAIQTLNHSLTVPNRTTPFQLKDLVDILAFEDEAEAGEFCVYYGLSVTGDCVNFQRSSFIEPETRFPMKRALNLIESKRNCSIGEIVYNSPLPAPPQHQPHLSFDTEGRYVGNIDELIAPLCKENIPQEERQVSIQEAARDAARQPLPPQQPPKTRVIYSWEEITKFNEALFLEVMNEMCSEITKEAMDNVHCYLELSLEINDFFHEHSLAEFIRETASSVIEEEKNNKRISEENAATKERVAGVICGEVTEELISLEYRRIAAQIVRQVQEEILRKAKEKVTLEICLGLIEEGVGDETRDLAVDVLEEEKAERDAKLQILATQVIRNRTARYFKRWLKFFQDRVHLKDLLSSFPPGPPIRDTEEQLYYLVGKSRQNISMATIRTDVNERAIHNALEKRQVEIERIRKHACRPLDIPSLLADSLRKEPVAERLVSRSPIQWKLLLSLPAGSEEADFSDGDKRRFISFVIKEKFKRGMYPLPNSIPRGLKKKIDLLSLYRTETGNYPTQRIIFKICTKACYGVLTNTEMREVRESGEFVGACAVLFVVDVRELLNHQAAREAYIRLRRLLESKPLQPSLPVAVVAIDSDSTAPNEVFALSRLGIDHLRNDGLLSVCKLFSARSHAPLDDLSEMLRLAVTWLGGSMLVSGLPRTDNLVNFIEDGLQKEFYVAVSEDMYLRKQATLEEQCPEAIVELFNCVLDHLAATVSSQSLQHISWPVSDFALGEKEEQGEPRVTWNCHENLLSLRSCIEALKLPPPPPAAADGTWASESQLCLKYARSLSPKAVGLLNRVQWILARAKRLLSEIDFLSPRPSPSASQVPWPLVLDACVNFRLDSLHSDPTLGKKSVYFLEEERESFVQPKLWTQSAKMSKEEATIARNALRLESSQTKKNMATKLHESYLDIEKKLEEINVSSQFDSCSKSLLTSLVTQSHAVMPLHTVTTPSQNVTPSSVTPSAGSESPLASSDSAVKATSERLKAAVEEAKMQSERFEDLLKNALGDAERSIEFGPRATWRKRKTQSVGEAKKSPKFFEGPDIPRIDLSFGALEENLSCFNETLKSQRRADFLSEKRLRQWLGS